MNHRVVLKIHVRQIQDSGRPTNFPLLNRCNSAVDCLISLNFCTEFDHVTADIHLKRSRSRDQRSRSHGKFPLIARISVPKYLSPNSMAVSEFRPEARKWQFLRMRSTNFAKTRLYKVLIDCRNCCTCIL